jgi:hypothetical protein
MKKVSRVKVGDVVQFPFHCFAPHRQGWNGWTFRVGIIVAVNGGKAVLRYGTNLPDRYSLKGVEESTTTVNKEVLFAYNVEYNKKTFHEFLSCAENGEQVCWNVDNAFLYKNGIF